MNHFPAQDAIRLEDSAEKRAAVRAQVRDYINRTGIETTDFAKRIGYGHSTFRMFMADRYELVSGNDAHIIRKCQEYMAAHPIAPSRKVDGDLFETKNVQLIRDTFAKLLQRPRAFMIYAPPGSQKTFVLEHEIYALNSRELALNQATAARAYLIYARHGITPGALVKRIAKQCGTAADGSLDRTLANLQHEFSGRRVLLVFDEAQHMSLDCFEVIRELLDRDPYFSLLFSGSHDLFLKFERASATLEQWNSRIAKKVRLPGCTLDEARQIVLREVGHILEAAQRKPGRRKPVADMVESFISAATVVDAYVPVPEGAPKATYINIRTLTTALDELRSQYEAEQPALAEPTPEQKEGAAA